MRSNDLYAWDGHYNVDRPYTANGLNQLTAAGATNLTHDARGNLSQSGSDSYGYDKLNRLISGPSVALTYDPADRLMQQVTGGTATTRFVYAGGAIIAEMTAAGAVAKRHVPGLGADEWVVSYDGSGTTSRSFAFADERGSILALADTSGSVTGVNRYDEYGIPAAGNIGRFQYTGQAWLPELGMSYYKARMYSPTLGRFMQTDPIGYGDGLNWYNYVGSDPVNKVDPQGSKWCAPPTGSHISPRNCGSTGGSSGSVTIEGGTAGFTSSDNNKDDLGSAGSSPSAGFIVVTGMRPEDRFGTINALDVISSEIVVTSSRLKKEPQKGDCIHRSSDGSLCLLRMGDGGKLVLDPEYAIKACENFKAIQGTAAELQNEAVAPASATAGAGSLVNWIYRLGKNFPALTVVLLPAALTNWATANAEGPPGCK